MYVQEVNCIFSDEQVEPTLEVDIELNIILFVYRIPRVQG